MSKFKRYLKEAINNVCLPCLKEQSGSAGGCNGFPDCWEYCDGDIACLAGQGYYQNDEGTWYHEDCMTPGCEFYNTPQWPDGEYKFPSPIKINPFFTNPGGGGGGYGGGPGQNTDIDSEGRTITY